MTKKENTVDDSTTDDVSQAVQEAAQAQIDQITEEQSQPSVTFEELRACASIIEVATKRGAFNADELLTVGKVYNSIKTFISSINENQTSGEG
jgi:hypothetical protein